MNNREARKLFKFKKDGKGYSVVRYLGTESRVIIPSQYRKKAVVKIEEGVFDDKSIELITIPNTVVNIQPQYCDVKIKLEDGNATYEVINNCLIEKATKKVISGGKDSIIPEGVKEIGKGAFSETSIEEITMPNTVDKIGGIAFASCKNLKRVTLNEGLKETGFAVFSETSIETVTTPSTVEKIGSCAFSRCKNLKTVTLNEGVKSIGTAGFLETSIEEMVIPSTVEEIESLTFDGCSELRAIECKIKKSYVEANKSKFEGLLEKESIINWVNG